VTPKTVSNQYIFVSYARSDLENVRPLVDDLRHEYQVRDLGVDIWMDVDDLHPGQKWEQEILRGLDNSIGLLVFVSHAALKSDWTRREFEAAAESLDRLIIPVILEDVGPLPVSLARRQWLILDKPKDRLEVHRAALEIANSTQAYLNSPHVKNPVSSAEAPAIASDIAREVRGVRTDEAKDHDPPDSVFVVHGHDTAALHAVEEYLEKLGIKSVVLTRIRGASQSLFQKFLSFSREARFAIVILTSDDLGASRHQYDSDNVGEKALQFRARQNVILELGFFYGYLGWENVFVVAFPPDKVFPNFERPSDLDGVIFDTVDDTEGWRESLSRKLGRFI
jgi:predicted nucleotide-binding protein